MWNVIGHQEAVRFLDKSLKLDRLSHAYLFLGPPNIGKTTLAMNLAQAVNCSSDEPPCSECLSCSRTYKRSHADLRIISVVDAEGRTEIGIDQVREMQYQAALKPYEGRVRVFILDEAERLSLEAANCLLKILEEPPPQLLIILVATDQENLPSTVCSRCTILYLRPLPEEEVSGALTRKSGIPLEQAQLLARLSQGRIGWALMAAEGAKLLEARAEAIEFLKSIQQRGFKERLDYAGGLASLFSRNRSECLETLQWAISWWRDLLLIKEGEGETIRNKDVKSSLEECSRLYSTSEMVQAITVTSQTQEFLEANANPRLALEHLMLSLPIKTQR